MVQIDYFLATISPYVYLAGNLIRRGEVDALECPDAGLGENGAANACGLEKAIPEVETWQNRFDVTILEAAGETGIPARLMKNLFAHESQFWPGILNFILIGGLDDSAATQVNLHAGTRLLVWPQLWEAVLQRPWFGWGLREVSEAHNAVLHAHAQSEPFTYAHNVVLDLAVGMGLPLTLLSPLVRSRVIFPLSGHPRLPIPQRLKPSMECETVRAAMVVCALPSRVMHFAAVS